MAELAFEPTLSRSHTLGGRWQLGGARVVLTVPKGWADDMPRVAGAVSR